MCHGHKTKQSLDELYLQIERGTHDGHEEEFRDQADESIEMRAGSVKIKIVQLNHPNFTRDGDNLKTDMEISL